MAAGASTLVLRYLHQLLDGRALVPLTDGQLLERFVQRRDEAAFEVLLRRHATLVHNVCRRLVSDEHLAEDVFQATFLVLARRAGAIRKQESVGSWLFGVAHRLSLHARGRSARRHERECAETDMPAAPPPCGNRLKRPPTRLDEVAGDAENPSMQAADPLARLSQQELHAVLYDELAQLPAKYQSPILLCDLQGITNLDAARQLGWPAGTLKSRLLRARQLLRGRLIRRGLALSVSALTALFAQHVVTAAVPARLLASTTRAALAYTAGPAAAGGLVSAEAAALAEGLLKTMILSKMKLAFLVTVTVGLLGMAAAGFLPPSLFPHTVQAEPAAPQAAALQGEGQKPTTGDANDDPLPPGALARLGTNRLRHGGTVTQVAFLPDGKSLLSASQDGTVRLWDLASGRELRRFGNLLPAGSGLPLLPPGSAGTISFSGGSSSIQFALASDGKTLATSGPGSAGVRLWDMTTGKELPQKAEVQPSRARGVEFSPDGKVLAVNLDDSTIHLCDVATGKVVHRLGTPQKGRSLLGLAGGPQIGFSPDGKTLAATMPDPDAPRQNLLIKLYEVASGKEQRQLKPSQGAFATIFPTFSPDGKTLAAIILQPRSNGIIYLWDVATGKELHQIQSAGTGASTIAFSRDSKQLYSKGTGVPTIHVWDLSTGKEARQIGQAVQPAPGAVRGFPATSTALALAPDGKMLATGSNSTIRLVDVASGKDLFTLAGHQSGISSLHYAADSKTLMTRGADGTIRLWDAATGKQTGQVPIPEGALTFFPAPDGKHLATLQRDMVVLWETASGKKLHSFPLTPNSSPSVTFTPDGKILAVQTTSPNLLIRLFDTTTGKELRQIGLKAPASVPPSSATQAAPVPPPLAIQAAPTTPAPPARTAAGAAPVQPPAVDAGAGASVTVGPSFGLVFSPDNTLMAAFAGPGVIGLWDLTTGTQVREIKLAGAAAPRSGVFSPDGRMLALDQGNNVVTLWEVASGRERGRFGKVLVAEAKTPGMSGVVAVRVIGGLPSVQSPATLAFSPDGKTLAHAGVDQAVRLWDVVSGQELRQFRGHQGTVATLTFAPDGKTLATGSSDTTALIWDVAAVSRGASVAPVELSREQVEARWDELAGADAAKAYTAINDLVRCPKQTVPILGERLKPAALADAKQVKSLIALLDSKLYAERMKATKELEALGELAGQHLKQALKENKSLETQMRIQTLVDKLTFRTYSKEQLQLLRAIEALERLNTPESRAVLQRLAAGAPDTLPTYTAAAALRRLKQP
jgi:RNA polymerase sigma factor (sigma-70 family)